MLRINFADSDAGQRWNLCGQLAGPWVNELRSCWQYARTLAPRSRAVVDLSDVTFIDEEGERLLLEMRRANVEFVAGGVETKHLLENLKSKGKPLLRRVTEQLYCGVRAEKPCTKKTIEGENSEKSS